MDIHQNARTTPASREELDARGLDDRLPVSLVATAAGVCPRTVHKWVARYQAEGPESLPDRSSRPHRQPRATPAHIVTRITALRLQRQPGIQIARTVGVSPATVSRVLRRAGLHRLDALEPSADGSNPAICGQRKPGHFRRPETGVESCLTASCVRKSVWTLVRQLRGPCAATPGGPRSRPAAGAMCRSAAASETAAAPAPRRRRTPAPASPGPRLRRDARNHRPSTATRAGCG